MKKITIYLLMLLLTSSCEDRKSTSSEAYNTEKQIPLDPELNKENTEARTSGIREYGQKIIDDKIQPSDDAETFACLDSLVNENVDTRMFFFQVYRVIAKKSDGALSEAVGSYTKNYLKVFPREALNHYDTLDSLEKKLFVENLAFEFYASGMDYKVDIDEYFTSIYNSNSEIKSGSQTIQKIKSDLVKSVSAMNY